MFGVSLQELALTALIALLVVGPRRLPQMLRTLGEWVRRLRLYTEEVRTSTGIDEVLRREGIDGGLSELRSMLRGDLRALDRYATRRALAPVRPPPPAFELPPVDDLREYPPEGVDAGGAIPDDLLADPDPSPTVEPLAEPRAPRADDAAAPPWPTDQTGGPTP